MKKKYWTCKNNKGLLTIHPELLPFVGNMYEQYRILIVGESHYINQEPTDEKDEFSIAFFKDNWFDNSCSELEKKSPGWYNTQRVLDWYIQGNRTKGHLIFTNIIKSFNKIILKRPVEAISDETAANWECLAFMNFYQMPSLYKGMKFWNSLKLSAERINNPEISMKVWDMVCAESQKVFDYVVEQLRPKLIVFSSESAYHAYNGRYKANIVVIPHAGCAWWNKRSKKWGNKSGKDVFEECLLKYEKDRKSNR